MKRLITIVAGSLCLIIGSVVIFAQESTTAGYSTVTAIEMTFQWKVEGDTLHCIVSAPTSGWVAVGFDPSRRMKDANIIIGYVDDGTVEVFDHYGVTPIAHLDDTQRGGTTDVTDISGDETNNTTEIRFSIPLDSGDKRDRALSMGKSYEVILAYGRSDSLRAQHVARTTVEIVLK
jgi:hypothetical protein